MRTKKTMQKALSWILALAMTVSMVPSAAFATDASGNIPGDISIVADSDNNEASLKTAEQLVEFFSENGVTVTADAVTDALKSMSSDQTIGTGNVLVAVGNVLYTDLYEAYTAATKENSVVVAIMLSDYALGSSSLPCPKHITGVLDLNGYSVTVDNPGETYAGTLYGDLTIKDSVGTGEIQGICVAAHGSSATIEGGTFYGVVASTDYNSELCNSEDAPVAVIKGGTFHHDVSDFVAEGYAALPDLNGNYVVGTKPTATVNNLGATTVAEDDYTVYGGSKAGDMPLSFVMQFLADESEEDMETSPFADWYGDFVITFTGIENGSFTADGCYLAGHYGDFGWVKVPVDGMTIENGTRYPVMLGVGMGQKYEYICSGVQDFRCAMYLTPEILEANPDLQVKLELSVVDNSKGSDAAAAALMNSENIYEVNSYNYTAEDFVPATSPEVEVGSTVTLPDGITADSVGKALAEANKATGGLTVSITAANSDSKTVTYDIAPKKEYTVPTGGIKMSLPVVGESDSAYVVHEHEDEDGNVTNYIYVGKVENGKVTITNTVGFSTFTVSAGGLGEALANASGEVVVQVDEKLTTTGISVNNSNITKLSFVGTNSDAEICLDGLCYIDVRYTNYPVEYTDLTLSHINGGYGGDGYLQQYFTTYNGGNVTYKNCTFPNGVCACGSVADTTVTFNDCTFNNTTSGQYSLWVYGNSTNVVVYGGTFCGVRGIKLYSEGSSDFSNLSVSDAIFSDTITEKHAVVLTKGESVTLTSNTFNNTTGTVQVDDDYASSIEGKSVTINGTSYVVDSTNLELVKSTDSDEETIEIGTVDELLAFAAAVNGGNTYEGKTVVLTADIDLTGTEWTPIGNGTRSSKIYTGNAFKGTFDGGNCTISGLTITSTTGDDAALGLFGVVDGGTVKNLNLTDVNINVSNSDLAGGAIGMMLNGATAENITVTGSVTGNDGVGGIVGRLIISGTISNCTNNAKVTSAYGGIGGIVGKAYYEDGNNTDLFASITGCTNNGTITAPMYVGGIVGLARSNVTGNTNNGAVVGGTQTGGIIGQLMAAGTVSGNENKAKISGKNHLGGIMGDYSQSSAYTYNNVTISNNINRGEVSATEQCAAIMGCNNIDGFTAMTATGNLSYYYVDGLELFGNPEDMVIDETNKFVFVAQVGDTKYTDLQEAIVAAAPAGTVEILSDITVDEWVMISETLTIGNDDLITLNINGMTINGNKHTLTVNSIESAGNGGYLFYDAQKLNINNLTIKYADDLIGGIGLQAGTLSGVTFDGGVYGVFPQSGDVTITGCTFKTNGTAIYFDEERDGLTVTGCTFNQPETVNVILLRGDVNFTGNTVNSGRTVNIVSGSPTVTGNNFSNVRLKVYAAATATVSNNEINNLVFEDTDNATTSTFTGNTLSADAQAALAAVTATEPTGLSGSGTAEDPYLISNLAELKWFRDNVTTNNVQYRGQYIKLTADIDLLSEEWTPIGSNASSFQGTFDGGGHIISNLVITGSNSYVGLFGRTNSTAEYPSEIKNFTLKNAKVSGSTEVGTVVGYSTNANVTYSNITVTGHIEVTGDAYVGGLAGKISGNCTNLTVDVDSTSFVHSNLRYSGGVIGWTGGIQTFTNLTSNATVTGDGKNVGGLIGIVYSGSTVKNVTFSGTVKVAADCESYGSILGRWENSTYVGDAYPLTVTDAVSNGTVIVGETTVTNPPLVGLPYKTELETADVSGSLVIEGVEQWLKVASVTDTDGTVTNYTTLADAFSAAADGNTVTLLSDVTESVTLPDGVTFNGNGCTVDGTVTVGGALTIKGVTKVKTFSAGSGDVVTIGEGACLEQTSGRMVIGHGATFNITGSITDAKTADVAELTPSLIAPGASFTGAGVNFNVTNAYVEFTAYASSKNSVANGTFNFNVTNSIWEQTNKLSFEVPTSDMDPTVNFNLKDSVLTTTSHLVFAVTKGKIVIDNSKVNEGEYRQLENRSNMTIQNGSVVYASVATSSNAWNCGTLTIDNATYIAKGTFSGSTGGNGTLILQNGAVATVPAIDSNTIAVELYDTSKLTSSTTGLAITTGFGYEVAYADGVYTAVEKQLSGSGTEAAPYLISTLDELILFRDSVNAGETTYNAAGVYVALDADIDMASVDWSVNIGDDCNATFDGIFDGKGHTISNLTSTETAAKSDGYVCAGLFGAIYGSAVVKNLTIENVTINTGDYTGNNVGVVVGFAYNKNSSATIDSVRVKGNINVTASSVSGVGGIIGYSYGKGITVKNCSVIGNDGSTISGGAYTGGIIGYASEGSTLSNNSVQNVTISGKCCVGGVAGLALGGTSATENTVKTTTLSATHENWQNSVAVVVGTISGGAVSVSDTTTENVTGATALVGSEWVDGPTEPVGAVEAAIGDTYYTTWKAALAAADAGETVTLLVPIVIESGEEVTIDLAGKTISQSVACTAHYAMITNNGTLTITDSVGGGKISFTDTAKEGFSENWGSYTIYNHGALVINSGTVENLSTQNTGTGNNPHIYFAISQASGSTTIKGGTICVPDYRSVRITGGTLTVEGGTFVGQVWAQPYSDGVSIAISGGEFSPMSGDGSSVFVENASKTVGLSVTGGTFNGKIGCSNATALADSITGGTFSATAKENTNSALIASGYDFGEADSNGYYTVATNPTYGKVASITSGETTTYYATLAEALTAAASGDTVTLLSDITLTETVSVTGTVVLDLNGKTVTNATTATITINGGDLTVKDSSTAGTGAIVAASTSTNNDDKAAILFGADGGKFTLESGTLKSTKYAVRSYNVPTSVIVIKGGTIEAEYYGVYDNSGSVTMSGGTITANTANISYGIAAYGTFTMNGGKVTAACAYCSQGTVDNTVAVINNGELIATTYNGVYWPSAGSLTINGGTITGPNAVYVRSGSLSITGGTLTGTGTGTGTDADETALTVENIGGTTGYQAIESVSITDGTFVSENVPAVISCSCINTTWDSDAVAVTGFISGGTYSDDSAASYLATGYALDENTDGTYGVKAAPVAKIGETKYETLAAALTAAADGDTITLLWAKGDDAIAMNGAVYGKAVTITGTATVDWDAGWLFIGRGGEGDGTLIFENANITSDDQELINSFGPNVSGATNSSTTNNGKLIIKNSTVEIDYLASRNTVEVDNSTVTIMGGLSVAGRGAAESTSGNNDTALIDLKNGSTMTVNFENTMGFGYESDGGIGRLVIDATSTYHAKRELTVGALGYVVVNGGTLTVDGTLTNGCFVTVNDGGTVKVNSLVNNKIVNLYGNETVQIDSVTAGEKGYFNIRDGAVLSNSYIKGNVNLYGSITFNGGFECVYMQTSNTCTLNIQENTTVKATYGVNCSASCTLNGGTLEVSMGDTNWGLVFQNNTYVINSNIVVNGNGKTAPIHFTNATATINGKITQTNSGGEPMYIGTNSVVTLGKTAEINVLSIHGAGKLIIDAEGMSAGEYANVKCSASGFTGTLEVINNDKLSAEVQNGKIVLVNKTVETYVAQIGDTQYTTLQAAFDAVKDGDTITLLSDITIDESTRYDSGNNWYEGVYYEGDKSFTIDLGGYKLTNDSSVNDYLMLFKNAGEKVNTITIKNGTVEAGSSAYCAICTSGGSTQQITLNLEDVNVIGSNSNGSVVKVRAGTVLNVKSGTVITGNNSYLGIESYNATTNIYDGAEIYQNGTASENGCLVGVGGGGTVNVTGGYGKGVKGGLIAMTSGGTINVSGGEWIANTDGTDANGNASVLIAQSDKAYNAGAGDSIVNVTGGTFKGGYNCYGNATGDAQINITGGTFNVDPTTYVVSGYKVVENDDGTYGVTEKAEVAGTFTKSTRSLSLAEVVYINQYVTIEGFEGIDLTAKGGMLSWIGDVALEDAVVGNENITNTEGLVKDKNSERYAQQSCVIWANQYGETVNMRFYVEVADGVYVYSDVFTYSVVDYCTAMFALDGYADYKQAFAAMLYYGAAAQVQFDHATTGLVSDYIPDGYAKPEWNADLIDGLLAVPSYDSISTSEFVSRRSNTLSLVEAIGLNCYFYVDQSVNVKNATLMIWKQDKTELTLDNVDYSVAMKEVTSNKTGYNSYAQMSDMIYANDLGETVFICGCIEATDGTIYYSKPYAYSPETYASAIYSGEAFSDAMKNLATCMVYYGDCVKAIFG